VVRVSARRQKSVDTAAQQDNKTRAREQAGMDGRQLISHPCATPSVPRCFSSVCYAFCFGLESRCLQMLLHTHSLVCSSLSLSPPPLLLPSTSSLCLPLYSSLSSSLPCPSTLSPLLSLPYSLSLTLSPSTLSPSTLSPSTLSPSTLSPSRLTIQRSCIFLSVPRLLSDCFLSAAASSLAARLTRCPLVSRVTIPTTVPPAYCLIV
jgi:hypothetical protein